MRPGNQSDLVKEFGVSRNAISLLVKNKDYRIIYTPSGKIDLDATIEALKKTDFGARSRKLKAIKGQKQEKKKTPSATKTEKKPEQPATREEIESHTLTIEDDRETIEKHKAFHQSEKLRIDNEKTLKQLIEVNTLTDRVFNFVRQFREHQQGQKDRIGSKIEGAESRHEIERIIEDDNFKGLSVIAEDFDDLSETELKKKIQLLLIR